MILSLQTDTFGAYGGIPTYNKLVCRVLDELGSTCSNTVLIASDKADKAEQVAALHPNLLLKGFAGNRVRFVLTALRVVALEQVELTLAGHLNYAPLGLLLKVLRPRMRFGVLIYGCDAWVRLPLLRRWALKRADFVVSISDYTKRQAVAINGLDERRIFVLPNALEWKPDEHRDREGTTALPAGTKLLSVGRLDSSEQQKGFDTVIRSLPLIAKSIPDIQYIIIGSGTDVDRHRQLAQEIGIAERVTFLGTVDDATLQLCYENCDLFVMPSAQEGFGFVYLEAMHYAKAVVAARSGGVPEVVEDGVTGRLVEYGNEGELTEALTDLCLNREKRARLGTAGYQRLQERFTFAHFNQKLTAILSKQLGAGTTSVAEVPVGRGTVETP